MLKAISYNKVLEYGLKKEWTELFLTAMLIRVLRRNIVKDCQSSPWMECIKMDLSKKDLWRNFTIN